MLYQSLLERKTFVKLKETQLFYLIMKLTKPFTVPKACTKQKAMRDTHIIFSQADNYTVIIGHGHVAVLSQGLQDRLGAKSANWLPG